MPTLPKWIPNPTIPLPELPAPVVKVGAKVGKGLGALGLVALAAQWKANMRQYGYGPGTGETVKQVLTSPWTATDYLGEQVGEHGWSAAPGAVGNMLIVGPATQIFEEFIQPPLGYLGYGPK